MSIQDHNYGAATSNRPGSVLSGNRQRVNSVSLLNGQQNPSPPQPVQPTPSSLFASSQRANGHLRTLQQVFICLIH